METNIKGWRTLVENLRKDLDRLAPNLHVTEISVSEFGQLRVYYSAKNLTPQQQVAVDNRVRKAESVAWQTCVVCGRMGQPAYIASPPMARVFCEEHRPQDWNTIEG